MSVEAFIDTNVLLYAISTAREEHAKKKMARDVLRTKAWGLSVQVLQEFYVNATRSPRPAMSHRDAVAAVKTFLRRPTVGIDTDMVLKGLRIKERYRLSYWDATIIAAAQTLGAATIYTEDLNDGQVYEDVKVHNPFA